MSFTYWEENYRRYTVPDASDGWLLAHARELLPGCAVLDLGCGAGVNTQDLLKLGARVSAADFSKKAIAGMRDRFSDVLERLDCFDMCAGFPYGDGSFDAVAADLSLHYFSWQETIAIVSGIRRILKTGGRLIARVHSVENLTGLPENPIEEHYYMEDGCARRYFTEAEIRTLFSDWTLEQLQTRQIHRYQRTKYVIEFTAMKR